jgi:hypothetical protein
MIYVPSKRSPQEKRRVPSDWSVKPVAAGKFYEVPHGEIHEVYVSLIPADTCTDESGVRRAFNGDIIESWFPAKGAIDPSLIIQWTQTGAVFDASATSSAYFLMYSMDSEGWILSYPQKLICTAAFKVLWRRRFDLEV